MKKFESALLEDLAKGDRFYFADDKHQKVWEKEDERWQRATVHLVGGGRSKRVLATKTVVFLSSKTEREAL